MKKPVTLIAAMDSQRAIGRGNSIPWHYPKDFAHFKRETLGSTLIMGRSTWDSIGRPLPGRETIVLTRDRLWTPGAYAGQVAVTPGLEEALEVAEAMPGLPMIAGGGQVYAEAMELATHQILTTIPETVEAADAFYPNYAEQEWRETRRIEEEGLLFRWLERAN